MYSGYINLPGTAKYYHYVFVPSTGNKATDPVVLWLNGGPGCSSLDGFFYEHGPYKFGPGLENITLVQNPYAYDFAGFSDFFTPLPSHFAISTSFCRLSFTCTIFSARITANNALLGLEIGTVGRR